jgi:hypothetical protein
MKIFQDQVETFEAIRWKIETEWFKIVRACTARL